jgi:hypothetical protein
MNDRRTCTTIRAPSVHLVEEEKYEQPKEQNETECDGADNAVHGCVSVSRSHGAARRCIAHFNDTAGNRFNF